MNHTSTQLFRLKAAVVAIAACFSSPVAWANPTGATVVNGAASFANNGNTLSITNTPGTILNWQQFNINQGQTTQFIQQSNQSSVLNRVISNQPSQILGTLRSNGQVFLINQAGIMFGVGSVVDVNGLIASTLNISNADFLLNRLNFNSGNGASVLNQGTITTPLGGRVYLIGNNVTNEGIITTPQGQVVLAAGQSVSLVDSLTPHISVTVTAGGQAINLGQISTAGGSIDVYAALIQQQGVLRADSASVDATGNIVLSATKAVNLTPSSVTSANGIAGGNVTVQSAGSTNVDGVVSATGLAAGGNIRVLGNQVALSNTAQIDVSGGTGGGSVLVGGDFQGKNAAVQNAFSTSVAPGAVIKADALINGNGGKSVVWANDTTTFAGAISARGGAQGGNGGNVEVSGKRILAFNGLVNTLAPKGKSGSFLLDPGTLCVTDASVLAACPNVITPFSIDSIMRTNGPWIINATNGDLIVIDPIILTNDPLNYTKLLTLQAINGNVLTLNSAQAQLTKGIPTVGGQIISNGGNVKLDATGLSPTTGAVHVGNSISTNGGSFTIAAQGVASIDGGGGTFTLANGTFVTNAPGVYTSSGAVSINATDFVLGWDQRTGVATNMPADINTLWGGVIITGSPLMGGSININTTGGTPANTGVTIGSGSAIYSGNSKISLSGYNFSNQNTAASYSIYSTAHTLLSFDHINTPMIGTNVGSLAFKPYTMSSTAVPAKNVYFGLANPDPRCLIDLCLMPSTGNQILTTNGVAIGSEGNITVVSNVSIDGRNDKLALVALNDIILNGSLTITPPTITMTRPFSVGNLAFVAGNNFINNVGAAAINLPAGHSWALFAKDQSTTVLNGLTAATVVNLAQDPLVFTPAAILAILNQPGKVGVNASNSPISNPALVQLLAGLTAVGGSLNKIGKTAGNLGLFWGSTYIPPTTPPLNCTLNPALCAPVVAPISIDCATNPSLCSSTTPNNAVVKTTAANSSALNTAVGNVTYSASLAVTTGLTVVAYNDVRISRQEARQLDAALSDAEVRMNQAKTSGERESAHREVETRSVLVEVKRAEARVRETELEAVAAAAEVRTAKSPEELGRAEIRQAVAQARRVDAEVKQADAEAKQAEIEMKGAKTPEAKAIAEVKKEAAETRKVQAEVKKAVVDAEKAEIEVKQAEAEVKVNATPQTKAAVEVKRAEAEVKKAEAEIKKAEVEVKTAKDPAVKANAEVKVAVAESKKADAEAQKANVEAKRADEEAKTADTPAAQRVAEVKKAEAEAKQAQAEVKKAEVEAKTAKDPAVKASAEEKVAQAELKKADAEVKVAEEKVKVKDTELAKSEVAVKKAVAEEKKAEVAVKTEKDSTKKVEAEVKLADAQVKKAEAEEKLAAQEVKAAREAVKVTHSADNKYVATKKVEASEARAVAKSGEFAAKKAEAEVKRVESELKQVESEVKEAKSPSQRADAERRLGEKRSEFESKRADAEHKGRDAEALKGEANKKEAEYHAEEGKRDAKVIAAFGGVDVTTMSPARVQEMMSVRHEFLKEKLSSALNILANNPKAADLKTCDTGGSGVCIRPLTTLVNFATNVIARISLPFMTPTTAFIPEIQRKVAVVIGNNAYQDPEIPALNGAVRDADDVGKMLKDKLGYDVRMVHNGTRADIVRTLNQVADETGTKDSVVVYYAGHGYEMEDTKVGYWIPSDASTSSPENWISNADINKMLSSIPAKQMLIVSDSCFSGALTNEQKVSSSITAKETPAEILDKRSVVIMSSGGEEPVMDEGRDGHSIFAWHLMDKLSKLDTFEHGAEMFDAIKAGVVKDGIPQTPQYGAAVSAGHSTGGDYLFEVRKY